MFIQKTEWGQVAWLHTSDKNDLRQSMDVGITTISPGNRIRPHIHYGHEQMLYILSGEGYYYINGEKVDYKKGMHFYLPADAKHETIPTGEEDTRELMVSNPVFQNVDIFFSGKNENIPSGKNLLYAAVEAIREQLLSSPFVPFTIFDSMWNIISAGGEFSEFCNRKCRANQDRKHCACLQELELSGISYTKSMQFQCPYGMTLVQVQIVYNNKSLGVIRGGHVLLSEPENNFDSSMYVTPAATFASIQKKLQQIVESIVKFCYFNAAREEIMQKDERLRSVETDRMQLKMNLTVAQENVTNLKINHHFLFNTLNSMASMALEGSNPTLYDAIIDLSKMFRYTMATDLRFMPFASELEYLQTYLNLQRLRYGDTLDVRMDIPEELYSISMPFNFLQPIVENAFTHGFDITEEKKKIYIHAEKAGKYVKIRIFNNGNMLDPITLNRVRKSLENNTGHGLSLIYAKLKSAYHTDFILDITSGEKNGTVVSVAFPIDRF